MGEGAQTRDLLAERIRRLEQRVGELGERVGATGEHVEHATRQLDALIGLVGRLSRIIDVQGDNLQGEEGQLERKVDLMDDRVADLARDLHAIATRLDGLGKKGDPFPTTPPDRERES